MPSLPLVLTAIEVSLRKKKLLMKFSILRTNTEVEKREYEHIYQIKEKKDFSFAPESLSSYVFIIMY